MRLSVFSASMSVFGTNESGTRLTLVIVEGDLRIAIGPNNKPDNTHENQFSQIFARSVYERGISMPRCGRLGFPSTPSRLFYPGGFHRRRWRPPIAALGRKRPAART